MLGQGKNPSGEGAIIKAFEEIRTGRYEESLVYLKEHLSLDPDDFWGWYLNCVAWGHLGNRDEMLSSLEKVRALNPGSLFPGYLEAYLSLLEGDLEKALLQWTHQVDYEEGWLARDLIDQARKGKDLISLAQSQGLEPFIILPDIMEQLRLHVPHESDGESPAAPKPPEKKRARRRGRFSAKTAMGTIGALVFAALAGYFLTQWRSGDPQKRELWRDFTIDSSAQLGPRPQSNAPSKRYQFENKDKLIEDFELAKKRMGEGRINQARFLLQRIFHSNADFKTREKTRIFLSFIPEPSHEEFSDPVFPGQLIKDPLYYTDSIVLWQGTVVKLEEKEGGRRVKMIVFENEKEYLVEAFLPEEGRSSNWQPYEEFEQKRKELETKKFQAVVYGKFKGLIGPQKIIYLELLKLWL